MPSDSLFEKSRRYLLIQTLALTFGGFLFYAGIVIPAATDVLGSTTQGFVTRRVTNSLNALGAVSTVLLVWDLIALRRARSSATNKTLLFASACIGLFTLLLVWLHIRLDGMLDPSDMTVADSSLFYLLHRVYLWVSTLQWLASLIAMWIVVHVSATALQNRDAS